MSVGYAAWKIAFQVSPIILNNGITGLLGGRMLPIIAITEALSFPLGLLSGGENIGLDSFFANFQVIAGSDVINQDLARVPFANQTVAANAVIRQPNAVSMMMVCPAQGTVGYYAKLPIMLSVIEALKMHNAQGGTYTIVTPSYVYTNCVMRRMFDASTNQTLQPQHQWQLDFEKPLITLADAEQAQNGLMSMLTNQLQVLDPVWSGLSTAASIPGSLAGPAIAPVMSGSLAANTAAASSLAGSGLLPL